MKSLILVLIFAITLTGCTAASGLLGAVEDKGAQAVALIVKKRDLEVKLALLQICDLGSGSSFDKYFNTPELKKAKENICSSNFRKL